MGHRPPTASRCSSRLAAGGSESTDAWADFLDELRGRGLRPPLLVISDGAAGLISAAESVLARIAAPTMPDPPVPQRPREGPRRRPGRDPGRLLGDLRHRELTAAGIEPGQRLVTAVQARIDAFAQTYGKLYPAAVKCLLTDREQLTSYLRFPAEHHKRIRHSNFIERTFGETRRRVKVIGRLPGETSCLNLVWAVLDRASGGWRGVTMTSDGPASCRTSAARSSTHLPPPATHRPAAQPDDQPETVSTVA